MLSNFGSAVRQALGSLNANRRITLLVTISLALGAGASGLLFTLVNSLLLQPVPVEKPAELVMVFTHDAKSVGTGFSHLPSSLLNYEDFQDRVDSLEGLAAYQFAPLNFSDGERPERLFGQIVTPNFFEVLGIRAPLGRALDPSLDSIDGAAPVVVLSSEFWRRRFGGSEAILGRQITLNGHAFTVVGIAPPGFRGIDVGFSPELWIPMAMRGQILTVSAWYENRRALFFNMVGRLAPGTTLGEAQAEMTRIAQQLEVEHPDANEGRSVELISLVEAKLNPNFRRGILLGVGVLSLVVGIVLFVTCFNVANLLLAWTDRRARELGMRVTLGATKQHLALQLLIESMLLASVAGLFALLVTQASELVWAFRPPLPIPVHLNLDPDGRVVLFTFLLSLALALVFGLLLAAQVGRVDLRTILSASPSAGLGRPIRRFRLRRGLIVAQIALATVAMVTAGLVVRSLKAAQEVDPGFDADHLAVMSVDLGLQGYGRSQMLAYYRDTRQLVSGLPEVEEASLASNAPLSFAGARSVFPRGRETDPQAGVLVTTNHVDGAYFSALALPMRSGRPLGPQDRADSQPVAVVNRTMAESFWPGESALGREFKFFDDERYFEIVGVAQDAKYTSLTEDPKPYVYVPLEQSPTPQVTLHVRTTGPPESVLPAIERRLQERNPELPVFHGTTLKRLIAESLWASRLGAVLIGGFGLIILVLATLGIYGLISYTSRFRRREFGIRVALGAERTQILHLVLRDGAVLLAFGLGLGLAAAFLTTRAMESMLVGIRPTDPVAFLGSAVLFTAAALAASYFPAHRATAQNPAVVMRAE